MSNKVKDFTDMILIEAMNQAASDIHFLPNKDHTTIFFRINGDRISYSSISKVEYEKLLSYLKFTSGMDIGESRKPQDGTLTFTQESKLIDLRLSTLPVEHSESLAIRLLPRNVVYKLEELFLFPTQANTLLQWIRNKFGIILFTGPTGSGKSTTMYSLLQTIVKNKPFQAITLEDPIEQELDHILQVQVNEKAGISYDAGLKAALRHDPDILMIGEIRDRQTARFAFHAAFTGHLVLSTIHAKNAYGTIFRLYEMGISASELSQTLIGVASQQLINCPSDVPMQKRTAILEILEHTILQEAINGKSPYTNPSFQSFEYLRRKANALSISKEKHTVS
ncbi:competence type IV pilus ATPase ComGA [Salirhabdus sp. Marseille-P4669]|uniref:competence type IV pilus ATPase ComGA n=1 Tax=Salirhabdus sp. Marseille-P4669 TaxID=2042310 RepID=UPI0035901C2A